MENHRKRQGRQRPDSSYISIHVPDFEREVQRLFDQQDEALVIIQKSFSGSQGRPRDDVLIHSAIELQSLLQTFAYTPDLFVLRGDPLPIRGIYEFPIEIFGIFELQNCIFKRIFLDFDLTGYTSSYPQLYSPGTCF